MIFSTLTYSTEQQFFLMCIELSIKLLSQNRANKTQLDVLFFFSLKKKETKNSSCIQLLRRIQQAAATYLHVFLNAET